MASGVNLGSVYATMRLDTSQFERGVKGAQGSLQSLSKTAGDSQKTFGQMFRASALGNLAAMGMARGISLLTSSVSGAVSRVDTLNNSTRTFNNMGFNDRQITDAMDKVNASILGLPTTLDDAVRNVTLLTSATQDLGGSQQLFTALNNGILGFGGSAEMVNNAVIQLSQGLAGGRLRGQEWLSMLNSGLGPALNAMAKEMGITTNELKEGLSDGSISVEKFQETLIKLNKEGGGGLKSLEQIAKDSTAGIQTGMTNMRTAISRGIANIIEAFGSARISGAISNIGKVINSIMGSIANGIEAVMPYLERFGQFIVDNFDTIKNLVLGVGVAVGTMALAFKAVQFATFISSMAQIGQVILVTVKSFGLFATITSFVNPVTLVIGAIGLLVGALVVLQQKFNIFGKAWDWIREKIEPLKPLLESVGNFIKEQFSSALESLSRIWNQLKESMQPLIDLFKEFWSNHGDKVMTVLKYIGIAIGAIAIAPLAVAFGTLLASMKVLSTVLGFVADHFDVIKKVVLVVLGVVFAPLILKIGLLVAAFKLIPVVLRLVWSVMQTVWNAIVVAWNAIYAVVSTVVNAVWNVVTTVWNAIWGTISFVLELIKNIITIVFGSILIVVLTVLNTMWKGFKRIWNAIWTFLEPIVTGIWEFLVNTFNNIKTMISNVFNGVWNFIKNIWNKIYNTISNLVGKIVDFFAPALSWLLDKGKDVIRGLIDGIKSMGGKLWNGIKSVADKIGQFFSGVGSWLFDSGKALFQGLIDGMVNIGNKVKETAENIVGKVRDLLPFSPAKDGPFSGRGWTKYSGQALMQGLADGIQSARGEVVGAMDNVLSGVGGNLNADITATAKTPLTENTGAVSIYGDVNIRDRQDADYLLQRLSRRQELTLDGLVGV